VICLIILFILHCDVFGPILILVTLTDRWFLGCSCQSLHFIMSLLPNSWQKSRKLWGCMRTLRSGQSSTPLVRRHTMHDSTMPALVGTHRVFQH
jgi:hypothetical protein